MTDVNTPSVPAPARLTQTLVRFAPWLLLTLGLLLSSLAYLFARAQEDARQRAAFELTVERVASGIDNRMQAHEYLLRGVAGLFAAEERVDRKAFANYVATLDLQRGYPGIQGIGFAQWIPPWALTEHIQQIRREGFPDYVVRPTHEREAYSAIVYLEPFDWRNRRAFGFDMFSEPVRQAAMAQARDTGEATVSGKVTLVQETDKDVQAGTLLYVPIYRQQTALEEVGQRREHLIGWAYSPLRMQDMMHGLLTREFAQLESQIGLALYDGERVTPEGLLYASDGAPHATPLEYRTRLLIGGRPWTLVAHAQPEFLRLQDSGRAGLVLGSGLLVTLLLTVGALQFRRSHRQIQSALERLSAANHALRQSQEELQLIYDASGAAMFVADTEGVIRHANQRMSEMFHCPAGQLIGSTYVSHLDPTERASGEQNLIRLGSGELPSVTLERRYRRANGEAFWGYISSRPLGEREGRVEQIVGVIVETTERHEAEQRLQQSEKRYRTLTETMLDVVWTLDLDTYCFTYCSPAVLQLRGYTADEIVGRPVGYGMPEAEAERILRALQHRAARFRAGEFGSDHYFVDDIPQTRKDGSTVWTEVVTNYYEDPDDGRLCVRGVTRNIDERKRAEEERRIAAVAFESHESMIVTDHEGRVIRANHAFEELNGYPAAEIIGRTLRFLHSGRHDPAFYEQMWRDIREKGFWQGEIWNRRKDGELSPQWLTITAVLDAEGTPTHFVGTAFDISQRLAQETEIRNLAFYDPLTGLANRRLLLDRLMHAFAKSSRSGNLGALIYLDLDRFKELNDQLGHAEGDRLLATVADRLNLSVREGDTVARLGGDEFVVLVEDLDRDPELASEQARVVAEKLHAALNVPYLLQGNMPDDWRCTPSIGVALFCDHRENSEALLERADRALYAAKKAGRNTIRFAEPLPAARA